MGFEEAKTLFLGLSTFMNTKSIFIDNIIGNQIRKSLIRSQGE